MVSPSAVLAHAAQEYQARPSVALSAEQVELRDGLLDHPAHIDPKFLYDALGSSPVSYTHLTLPTKA